MKRPFHYGDLRNALIIAAKDLLERKGVEAFALREVARNVGVSANAAYNHLEDKDALLSAVASSGFAELEAQRAEARARADPDAWSRLSAGARVYAQFAEARPKLFDLMFGPLGIGARRITQGRRTARAVRRFMGPRPTTHLGRLGHRTPGT